jgi:hypothetical protein
MRFAEILPFLLGCYQEILQDIIRRRWTFGFEGQLEMSDGPADCL